MIYSYTQISHYLRCPRSYRYRYLDGWREKDTRAAMVFGRCFEKALAPTSYDQDCTVALFKNGKPSVILRLNTGKGRLGIGCCTKAFICSRNSYGRIGFVSPAQGEPAG